MASERVDRNLHGEEALNDLLTERVGQDKEFRSDAQTLPVHRMLRALLSGGRAGILTMQDGSISFRNGRIVDAHFEDADGEKALHRALMLTDKDYSVRFGSVEGRAELVISQDEYAAQIEPLVEQFRALVERSLPLEATLTVDFQALAHHLASLPDDVNSIVRLFDGHRTVKDCLFESPFAATTTLQAATRLYSLGVLTAAQLIDQKAPQEPVRLFEPESHTRRALNELFGEEAPPLPEADPLPTGDWTDFDRMSPELVAQLDAFRVKTIADIPADMERHPAMGFSGDALDGMSLDEPSALEDAINEALVGDEGLPMDEELDEALDVRGAEELEFDIDVVEGYADDDAEEQFFEATGETQLPDAAPRRALGALAITVGVAVIAVGVAAVITRSSESAPAPVVVAAKHELKPAAVQMPELQVPAAQLPKAAAAMAPTYEQGVAFYEAGFIDDAVTMLEEVVAKNPSAPAWAMLGVTRFDSGNTAGAEEAAKKALAMDPKNGRALMLLATVYIDEGEHELADVQLKKYLADEPNGDYAAEAQSLLERKRLPRKH